MSPATPRCRAIASNAQRSGIAAARVLPVGVITGTGTIAPEKSTAGKHSIGSARAACATEVTEADASSPRNSATTALMPRVTNRESQLRPSRLGSRSRTRSTTSMAAFTTSSTGASNATLEAR